MKLYSEHHRECACKFSALCLTKKVEKLRHLREPQTTMYAISNFFAGGGWNFEGDHKDTENVWKIKRMKNRENDQTCLRENWSLWRPLPPFFFYKGYPFIGPAQIFTSIARKKWGTLWFPYPFWDKFRQTMAQYYRACVYMRVGAKFELNRTKNGDINSKLFRSGLAT